MPDCSKVRLGLVVKLLPPALRHRVAPALTHPHIYRARVRDRLLYRMALSLPLTLGLNLQRSSSGCSFSYASSLSVARLWTPRYTATRHDSYLHAGKAILQSFNNHSKVQCGYASIADVETKRCAGAIFGHAWVR